MREISKRQIWGGTGNGEALCPKWAFLVILIGKEGDFCGQREAECN